MYLNLTNKTNDYKLNERTQVKFCFTVKGKKYALALINTLKNANFESYANFNVFVCDKDAKDILIDYSIPYRQSYGINAYHDRILNVITMSSENPNTLILGPDIMTYFDFHETRGFFGHGKYEKGLYLCTRSGFGCSNDDYICGTYNSAYNVDTSYINEYEKQLNNTKSFIVYPDEESKLRYLKEQNGLATDEEVLSLLINNNNLSLHINDFSYLTKLLRSTRMCGGGNTLNYMIKNKKQYHNGYFFNKELLDETAGL